MHKPPANRQTSQSNANAARPTDRTQSNANAARPTTYSDTHAHAHSNSSSRPRPHHFFYSSKLNTTSRNVVRTFSRRIRSMTLRPGQQVALWIVLWASTLVLFSILLPGFLVKKTEAGTFPPFITTAPTQSAKPAQSAQPDQPLIALEAEEPQLQVSVYLTAEDRVINVPLEYYVRGVLAAEMPAEFELEALKAQAITARTYIIRRMVEQDYSHVPAEGAVVTDSIIHQAYLTKEQLQIKWDAQTYTRNINKMNQAVNETRGLVVTYENRPIDATFFSTSNGFTENSEDYWSAEIPYLRSVPSPWDQALSPKYKETVSYPFHIVFEKLGIPLAQPTATIGNQRLMTIVDTSEGNRIKEVMIANHTFTGREVREKLGLNSSQFTWEWNGDQIQFTTYGYGHGVGMSQYGANGMAQEGKNAEEIIKYYYQDVEIKILASKKI